MIMKTYLSVSVTYFFLFRSFTIFSSVHGQLVGFKPLSAAVPQDVNGIQLGIYCDGSLTGRYRTGIVTVEAAAPGSTIQVFTYPPDLVTAVVEDTDSEEFSWFRYLRLEYNPSVAGALGGGPVGVQIMFPSDKLEAIWMGAGSEGQLIGNFPPLTNIEVTGGSQLYASLSGEANDDLLIEATGEETKVYLSHEGGSIPKLIATEFAFVEIAAMKVLEVDISNSATASLEVLVPPGGTIDSSGDSSTASLDINLLGGCKRIVATNAAKCTDGIDLDLRDVTAIVEDVSNMVVEGATATCIRDERPSSSSSSSAGGSNVQSDGNGNDDNEDSSDKNGKSNGGAIAGAIIGIILGLILLGILAWLGWRLYNKNKTDKSSKEASKSKPAMTKQDSNDRGQRKHHDDIEAPLSPSKKTQSTSTKAKKRTGSYGQDQSVPSTPTQSPRRKLRPPPLSSPISPTMSLREDERDIPIPATPPYSKKRSIPPKKKVVEKSSKKKPLQLEDAHIVTPATPPTNKRSISPPMRGGEKNGKKKPQQKPPKVVKQKPGHNHDKQNNPRK